MEKLLGKTSKTLNCRYLPDIDIQNTRARPDFLHGSWPNGWRSNQPPSSRPKKHPLGAFPPFWGGGAYVFCKEKLFFFFFFSNFFKFEKKKVNFLNRPLSTQNTFFLVGEKRRKSLWGLEPFPLRLNSFPEKKKNFSPPKAPQHAPPQKGFTYSPLPPHQNFQSGFSHTKRNQGGVFFFKT